MSGRDRRLSATGGGIAWMGPKVAILATAALFVILFVLAPRGGRQQEGPAATDEAPADAAVSTLEPGGDFPLLQEPRPGFSYELPATAPPEEPDDSAAAEPAL